MVTLLQTEGNLIFLIVYRIRNEKEFELRNYFRVKENYAITIMA